MTDYLEEDTTEPREERTVYWAGRQWCVTSFGLETVIDHEYDVAAAALGHLTDGSDEPMAERLRIGSMGDGLDKRDKTASEVSLAADVGSGRAHGCDGREGTRLHWGGSALSDPARCTGDGTGDGARRRRCRGQSLRFGCSNILTPVLLNGGNT